MTIGDKTIDVFGGENAGAPLVVLNTFEREGKTVWNEVKAICEAPFTLAAISNLNWERDMTPWAADSVFKGGAGYAGGADAYLEELASEIYPAVISNLKAAPNFSALAGYSLGGLFAAYAAFRTEIFSRVASASGSFWFPGFAEFVATHNLVAKLDFAYFSLGDKEATVKNPILASVGERTDKIISRFSALGVTCRFEQNEVNHFKDAEKRTARAIKAVLKA